MFLINLRDNDFLVTLLFVSLDEEEERRGIAATIYSANQYY